MEIQVCSNHDPLGYDGATIGDQSFIYDFITYLPLYPVDITCVIFLSYHIVCIPVPHDEIRTTEFPINRYYKNIDGSETDVDNFFNI